MMSLSRVFQYKTLGVALRATTLGVFVATLVYASFDLARTQIRLTNAARARLATRTSTERATACESIAISRSVAMRAPSVSDRARATRDAQLTNAARAFVADAPLDETRRRQIALRGLARWDVDAIAAREFAVTSEDARLFASAPRESWDRAETATAYARESLAALETDERDPALDAALAFLDAYDEETGAGTHDDEWTLWSLDYESGDPLDAGGYVAYDEFDLTRNVALARRAHSATALFTLSSFLFLLIDRRVMRVFARAASLRALAFALALIPLFHVSSSWTTCGKCSDRRLFCLKFAASILSVRLLI